MRLNTNVAGLQKIVCYLNDVPFYNCNMYNFSNGYDTCN